MTLLPRGLFQDLRYGVRVLRQQPGTTAVAVLSLALGIGAVTAIFSVLDAVVLRVLPYRAADRLGLVWVDFGEKGQSLPAISSPDFRDLRETSRSFVGFGAGTGRTANLTGDGEPEQVELGAVTHDFFAVLGVEPALGRSFSPAEDVPNGPAVALLSHELWQRRYGGDPSLPGRNVQVNGIPHQVIGVMPAGFDLLLPRESVFLKDSDVWVPLQDTYDAPRNRTVLTAFARLRDEVTFDEAQGEVEAIAARLREAHEVHQLSGTRLRVEPLERCVVRHVRGPLLAVFAAAGFVLLIACGNVAGLLLARATARGREIAIRRALGAGRGRIVRQLLAESLVLGCAGSLLGVWLAAWGIGFLRALAPAHLPRVASVGIDGSVLAFAAVACGATVLLFGVVPALRGSCSPAGAVLGAGTRCSTADRQLLRRTVVVGQVALSLMLLVGVGLLTRSFALLQRVDPGFDSTDILTFRLSLPASRYGTREARAEFYRQLEQRLRALPGVASVGAVSQLPLGGGTSQGPYAYDDETAQRWESVTADARAVTPGYFPTMGSPLVAGRWLDEHDDAGAARVVVVDEKLAQKAWRGGDPLSRQLLLPVFGPQGLTREWHDVVGVVRHTRLHDLSRDVREQVWFPHAQRFQGAMDVVVRGAGEPTALGAAIRGEVRAMDAELPVHALRPMDEYVARALAQPRFTLSLSGAFGAIALLLAVVGLYGVVSYAAAQRTREFGIRLALGAQARGILWLVLGQGARLAALGLIVGLVGAGGMGAALAGLLFGVSATDPLTFVVAPLLLTVVALVACWLPARRATRTDPVVTLRHE